MPQVRFNPAKWANRSQQASPEYATGVQNPRRSWAASAQASEGNYAAGVSEAASKGSYGKGVARASDAKWQKGALEKGRTRYGQGVSVSQEEYSAGFQPYANAINGLTLQPRGPKGSNYGRVQQIGDALRNIKQTR